MAHLHSRWISHSHEIAVSRGKFSFLSPFITCHFFLHFFEYVRNNLFFPHLIITGEHHQHGLVLEILGVRVLPLWRMGSNCSGEKKKKNCEHRPILHSTYSCINKFIVFRKNKKRKTKRLWILVYVIQMLVA